jgi:hypothetical protein
MKTAILQLLKVFVVNHDFPINLDRLVVIFNVCKS